MSEQGGGVGRERGADDGEAEGPPDLRYPRRRRDSVPRLPGSSKNNALNLNPAYTPVQVYAFGILLWEAYTGGNPFEGIPRALLGHQVRPPTLSHPSPHFLFLSPHHFTHRQHHPLKSFCTDPRTQSHRFFCFPNHLSALLNIVPVLPSRTPHLVSHFPTPYHCGQPSSSAFSHISPHFLPTPDHCGQSPPSLPRRHARALPEAGRVVLGQEPGHKVWIV